MMKLYYSPGACSFAPHIILEEIKKPYDIELVSTNDGSTRKAGYLAINPKGRVPALYADGELITEVSAILTFLATTNPQSNLLSDTPIELTRSIEWMNWLTGIHATAVAQIWRAERFTDDVDAFPGIKQKGMKNLTDAFELINAKLTGLVWAVENQYSIVDPYLLGFSRWGNRLGIAMREYAFWTQHTVQMERRDAVISVLKQEGISIWK